MLHQDDNQSMGSLDATQVIEFTLNSILPTNSIYTQGDMDLIERLNQNNNNLPVFSDNSFANPPPHQSPLLSLNDNRNRSESTYNEYIENKEPSGEFNPFYSAANSNNSLYSTVNNQSHISGLRDRESDNQFDPREEDHTVNVNGAYSVEDAYASASHQQIHQDEFSATFHSFLPQEYSYRNNLNEINAGTNNEESSEAYDLFHPLPKNEEDNHDLDNLNDFGFNESSSKVLPSLELSEIDRLNLTFSLLLKVEDFSSSLDSKEALGDEKRIRVDVSEDKQSSVSSSTLSTSSAVTVIPILSSVSSVSSSQEAIGLMVEEKSPTVLPVTPSIFSASTGSSSSSFFSRHNLNQPGVADNSSSTPILPHHLLNNYAGSNGKRGMDTTEKDSNEDEPKAHKKARRSYFR